MQLDQRVLAGIGGVLVGAVLAYAGGSAGRADLEARLARQDQTLTSVAALDAALARLDQRVDSGLADLATRADSVARAAADRTALDALAERVEALSSDLPGAVASVGDQVRGALAGDFESLAREVAALARPAVAVAASAEAGEPARAPAASLGEGVAIRVGQTVPVDDGMRVFLSGIDAHAGTARVAVNGVRTTSLRLGEAAADGNCALTLTGIEGRSASFAGSCAATTQAKAQPAVTMAVAAEGGSGAMPSDALGIGQTGLLAESVRLFLSSVSPEEGVARVAVNGWRPVAVALGMPIEVGSCSVTMTHVEPGRAAFSGDCGGEATGIVPAAARAEAPAPAAGEQLRVGEASEIAEMLRVYLSSVDPEAGTARVAINGTDLTTLALALPHKAGDCTLQLVAVEGRTATLGGDC